MKKRSEFSGPIAELRGKTNLNLSQAKFANVLGVSRSTVSAWELGDSNPVSRDLAKLGNLAKGKRSIWFWEKAGISKEAMVFVANELAADYLVRPERGQMVRVGPLTEPKEAAEERPDLLLPVELVPRPFLTKYLVIDEESRGYGLEIGDFLLVDISDREGPNLLPFWNRRVLVRFDAEEIAWQGGVSIGQREQIVGRLILKAWGRTPGGFSWMALLQPWNDQLINIFRRPGDETMLPEALWIGTWERRVSRQSEVAGTARQTKLDLSVDSQKEAEAQLQLNRNCRILGRVVGWIERPREKK